MPERPVTTRSPFALMLAPPGRISHFSPTLCAILALLSFTPAGISSFLIVMVITAGEVKGDETGLPSDLRSVISTAVSALAIQSSPAFGTSEVFLHLTIATSELSGIRETESSFAGT